jgi:hypothetical protein
VVSPCFVSLTNAVSFVDFFKQALAWEINAVAASDGRHKCLHGEIHLVQVKVNGLYVNHARPFRLEQEAEADTGVYKTLLFAYSKAISVFMAGHSNYSRFAQDWFPRRKVRGTGAPYGNINPYRLLCGHCTQYSVLYVKLINSY